MSDLDSEQNEITADAADTADTEEKAVSGQIPPLSQSEKEHLTYLRILGEYNEAKDKRANYRRYGTAFIIIFGIVVLTLIFSLDAKIEFLILWIVVILASVTAIINADFRYQTFKEYLGIEDEEDKRRRKENEDDEIVDIADLYEKEKDKEDKD